MGSSSDRVKPKTMKLVFVASPLSMQQEEERAKTCWLELGNVLKWDDMSICGLLFQ
jgi:hypothetical protein